MKRERESQGAIPVAPSRPQQMAGRRGQMLALMAAATAAAATLAGCERLAKGKGETAGEGKAKLERVANVAVREREGVTTATAALGNRQRYTLATATLEASQRSDVASRRMGIVRRVLIERGSVVKAGDPLVVLDNRDNELALQEGRAHSAELAVRLGLPTTATASSASAAAINFSAATQPDVEVERYNLELAAANFRRDQDLLQRRAISQADFDRSRTTYESSRRRLDLAQKSATQMFQQWRASLIQTEKLAEVVADTTVTAPFAGVVAEKLTNPGEWLMEGAKVATLVQLNPLKLLVTIPEAQTATVQEGQMVEFQVSAYPAETFGGKVRYIGAGLNAESRALTLEAIVDNGDNRLRPGYFATARLLQDAAPQQVVQVPVAALRREGDVARVYVVDKGTARERVVSLGDITTGTADILSGLRAGEIVAADLGPLEDGMQVR